MYGVVVVGACPGLTRVCVAAELRQGQLIDTQVDRKTNPDGSVTETTVYTVKDGNVTKKITEVKTTHP